MPNKLSVDIIIPVLNEELVLANCIKTLRDFLTVSLPNPWRIVIVDNGSEDNTEEIARQLECTFSEVSSLKIAQRGRGRALRKAWLNSSADIVSYMDVDLSSDLQAFPSMIENIELGYDVAIGSRLTKGSRVNLRSRLREITSRTYNLLIKVIFATKFTDAQCGFKAITFKAAQALVPNILDNNWFFDTELLILAEKNGFKIKEIPVIWTDDPDSRVNIISTAIADLRGLLRLRLGGIHKIPTEKN